MAIKVILWDIDGTLLNQKLPERNAIKAASLEFGLGEVTEEELDLYPEINDRWWAWCEEGRYTKAHILWGRFEEFLRTIGKDSSSAEAFSRSYMRRLGDTICFYPHGKETIEETRKKVKQYVVTNGASLSQEGKVQNSGIDTLMDGIFISEEVGYEKPTKEFFDKVLSTIGDYRKDEVMIVGDSLTTDMKGGNNAGILCCWYNRKGKKKPEGLRIDYEITDLSQVLDIIKEA